MAIAVDHAQRPRSFKRWYVAATAPYALLLLVATLHSLLDPGAYGSTRAYIYLGGVFFVTATLLVRFASGASRRVTAFVAIGVIMLSFLSGGPAGFILFAPSIAILLWLAVRKSRFV